MSEESVGGVRREGAPVVRSGSVGEEESVGGVDSGGGINGGVVTTGDEAGGGPVAGGGRGVAIASDVENGVGMTRPIMLFNAFARMSEQTAAY